MDSVAMVQAVEAWVVDTLPGFSSFDYPPEELNAALPMVLADIQQDAMADASDELPGMAQYQQTFLRLWTVEVTLLVSPDPAWTASHALYGHVDDLGRSLRGEVRIGDNVALSQYYDATYDPPEIEYQDGTIARQVTITVVVGETVGA